MSSDEVNSSTGTTPQHSIITSTTSEDDSQNNADVVNPAESSETSSSTSLPENSSSSAEKDNAAVESDSQVVRSESVIKSPSKPLFVSSSTTPVIKVVDSSQETTSSDSEAKRSSIGTSVIAQTSSSTSQSASPQNSTSFLHSASSPPTPSNPFLRTSSFSANISSSSSFDSSDPSSDIFAPPKLLAPFSSGNLFETSASFQRPSVLRAADSNNEGNSSETISSSKTFISLNKEDIGKIKTPAFIKNSLDKSGTSFANGSASSSKESEDHTVTTNDEKPLFTFGQNLSDRVVFDCVGPSTKATELKSAEINSTSDNLISFSDVTNYETSLKDNSSDSIKSDDSKGEKESDGLTSSSSFKNGESSDGVFKRKYEVITGEEDEQNVLSIHGKLYAWDPDQTNWTEKGRGHLRLNDVVKNDKLCSRLVMRTSGALRVILNAHVVAGMKFELANDNCLRFTNVDGIYLIKANPKDIDQLNQAIEYRLREITKRVKTDTEPVSDAQDEDDNPPVDSI